MKLRAFPLLAFLAFVAASPHLALAADPPKSDPAGAHVLFYEARALMQQNRFAEACPKLEESMRLDAGIGTQFNLADCQEHLGKVTSAWAGFVETAAASKAANQPEREKVARKRAEALEPRLPRLVIEVPSAPPGLEVKRDGVVIGAAAFGTPTPVDPGTHRITATATGKGTWETTTVATEGKTARVSVPRELPQAPIAATPTTPVPVVVPQPVASGATTTTTSATTSAPTDFPPPVVEQRGSALRTVGWIAAGAGVAGLGVGAGFGLASLGKRNEARSHCVVDQCDAAGVSLRDDAIRRGNVATVATIAGATALVGGVVLILTSPTGTESRESGKLRAVPNVAMNGGGLLLQGNFR